MRTITPVGKTSLARVQVVAAVAASKTEAGSLVFEKYLAKVSLTACQGGDDHEQVMDQIEARALAALLVTAADHVDRLMRSKS